MSPVDLASIWKRFTKFSLEKSSKRCVLKYHHKKKSVIIRRMSMRDLMSLQTSLIYVLEHISRPCLPSNKMKINGERAQSWTIQSLRNRFSLSMLELLWKINKFLCVWAPWGCNVKQLRCYNTTIAESNPSMLSNLALSRRNDNCAVS